MTILAKGNLHMKLEVPCFTISQNIDGVLNNKKMVQDAD